MQLFGAIRIQHDRIIGLKLPALLKQAVDLPIRGQRNHPETFRMARNDIQGIHADRPGRTEHGNILNFWHLLKSRNRLAMTTFIRG